MNVARDGTIVQGEELNRERERSRRLWEELNMVGDGDRVRSVGLNKLQKTNNLYVTTLARCSAN
jgi:hypothetical protein